MSITSFAAQHDSVNQQIYIYHPTKYDLATCMKNANESYRTTFGDETPLRFIALYDVNADFRFKFFKTAIPFMKQTCADLDPTKDIVKIFDVLLTGSLVGKLSFAMNTESPTSKAFLAILDNCENPIVTAATASPIRNETPTTTVPLVTPTASPTSPAMTASPTIPDNAALTPVTPSTAPTPIMPPAPRKASSPQISVVAKWDNTPERTTNLLKKFISDPYFLSQMPGTKGGDRKSKEYLEKIEPVKKASFDTAFATFNEKYFAKQSYEPVSLKDFVMAAQNVSARKIPLSYMNYVKPETTETAPSNNIEPQNTMTALMDAALDEPAPVEPIIAEPAPVEPIVAEPAPVEPIVAGTESRKRRAPSSDMPSKRRKPLNLETASEVMKELVRSLEEVASKNVWSYLVSFHDGQTVPVKQAIKKLKRKFELDDDKSKQILKTFQEHRMQLQECF